MPGGKLYWPKNKLTLASLWLWAVAILAAIIGFESTTFSSETGFANNSWTNLFIASLLGFLVFGLAGGLLLGWESLQAIRTHEQRRAMALGAACLIILGIIVGFIGYLAHLAGPSCGCGA